MTDLRFAVDHIPRVATCLYTVRIPTRSKICKSGHVMCRYPVAHARRRHADQSFNQRPSIRPVARRGGEAETEAGLGWGYTTGWGQRRIELRLLLAGRRICSLADSMIRRDYENRVL